jgi:hypothetical protein
LRVFAIAVTAIGSAVALWNGANPTDEEVCLVRGVPVYVCYLVAVCIWIPYGGVHLLLDRAEKHYDSHIAKAYSNMGFFPYEQIP